MIPAAQKNLLRARLRDVQFSNKRIAEKLAKRGIVVSTGHINNVLRNDRNNDEVWLAAAEVVAEFQQAIEKISSLVGEPQA